jgi:hypothetical protein
VGAGGMSVLGRGWRLLCEGTEGGWLGGSLEGIRCGGWDWVWIIMDMIEALGLGDSPLAHLGWFMMMTA